MILITGGAGYIGSHANKLFSNRGYKTVVLDNLIYGHKEFIKWGEFVLGDLSNIEVLDKVFGRYSIDTVLHFAAYAYVGESIQDPAKYYLNNIGCTLNLLEAMRKHNCQNIVFSSSCTIYGIPEYNPITEDTPQNPINPYGRTKLTIEKILQDYSSAYGIKYLVFRYFNACGADPECEIGEWHIPETHLIPIILDV
jgi:UDP-glucose 4-epimerase